MLVKNKLVSTISSILGPGQMRSKITLRFIFRGIVQFDFTLAVDTCACLRSVLMAQYPATILPSSIHRNDFNE